MKGEAGETRGPTVLADLPESVLHHILSYLPLKYTVRTSVLSKQWNSARKSNPFLDFNQPKTFRMPAESPRFKEWRREFLKFVDRTLKHFDRNKLCIERLHLLVFQHDEDSFPLINTWFPLALRNGVSDLQFTSAFQREREYFELSESTFAVNSSLLGGSFKFFRLKKLKLNCLYLSENIVGDIIRNCPNISHLSLLDILGLETLNISKLNKLVSLKVSSAPEDEQLVSVYVNVLSLEQVSVKCLVDEYDLTSCCNLRKIYLVGTGITDAQFHQHISKFPLLEVLKIEACDGLRSIKISSQRLKHLSVEYCRGVEAIEIDAPILSSFEFEPSSQNVLVSVSSKVTHCSMYISYGMESSRSWSLKLRDYLGVPFNGLNFDQYGSIKFTFGPDMSREVVKFNCLDLTGLRNVAALHWVALLDTLLSKFHPKIVSMTVDSSDEENCVNILRKMLVQNGCQLCCNLPHCKCWRSYLKGAKIKSINGIELKNLGKIDDKQFLRVFDTFLSIPEDREVQFEMNWDHSEFISPPLKSLPRLSISSE